MITWELRLYSPATGKRVATLDQWPELQAEIGVNEPAAFALRLRGDDARIALIEQDALLEGWWCDQANGIAWRREFCCFCVDWDRWTDAKGARHYMVSGRGLEDLLARTDIETYAGSPQAQKSGPAETAMKAYVEEQAGPSAGGQARLGLTVESGHAPALGPTWAGSRSNKNLLAVLQEIAEYAGLQFGIARTGPLSFEFRVWQPVNRLSTVLFAEERGNMAEPRISHRQSGVINYVRVGGQGEGVDRVYRVRTDPASIALSPWNRRAAFLAATDQSETAQYDARGDAKLAENRAQSGLSFRALQSPGCLYGLHYELGDLVSARYDGVTYAKRVNRVVWAQDGQSMRPSIELIDAEAS